MDVTLPGKLVVHEWMWLALQKLTSVQDTLYFKEQKLSNTKTAPVVSDMVQLQAMHMMLRDSI